MTLQTLYDCINLNQEKKLKLTNSSIQYNSKVIQKPTSQALEKYYIQYNQQHRFLAMPRLTYKIELKNSLQLKYNLIFRFFTLQIPKRTIRKFPQQPFPRLYHHKSI